MTDNLIGPPAGSGLAPEPSEVVFMSQGARIDD
jgi:hypothetical protein